MGVAVLHIVPVDGVGVAARRWGAVGEGQAIWAQGWGPARAGGCNLPWLGVLEDEADNTENTTVKARGTHRAQGSSWKGCSSDLTHQKIIRIGRTELQCLNKIINVTRKPPPKGRSVILGKHDNRTKANKTQLFYKFLPCCRCIWIKLTLTRQHTVERAGLLQCSLCDPH